MAATQVEIAKRLGLSRSTVAAALNPHSSVKLREETRHLIVAEAERLNYRPHRYAQIMRAGKSGLIGVFHFGGLAQVAAERVWHASDAIQKAGYQVLANDASWTSGGVKAGCEAMLDARVEGVIIAGLNDLGAVEELKLLRAAKIPVVALSGNEFPGAPQVRGDAETAFENLTRHLIGLGRKRLLLLFSLSHLIHKGAYLWAGLERLQGFRAGLAAAGGREVTRFSQSRRGLEGKAVGLEVSPDPFDPFQAAREALPALLGGTPPPDAILCANDDWAIGTLAALRERGYHVPDDIALTGYDNISVGAYLDVPLTTAAQPSKAMAERAVELLLKKIRGGRVSSGPLKFPCKLVIRDSCGASRSATS
jgi:DNA-binding LacI/PurR family transcriptional regulator